MFQINLINSSNSSNSSKKMSFIFWSSWG